MSPTLVDYKDFHDQFILDAFENYISSLIAEIMNLHFMMRDLVGQNLPEVIEMQRLSISPEEVKKML